MKVLTGFLAGFVSMGLLNFLVLLIGCSLYGLVLAFKASILIGLLALIIEPAPFIIGLVMLFANINLAQRLAELIFN